ncbi:MAG: hypothetical protein H5T62_04970 [Anaerolineae bacterium]|nr:hypothetical protein [Anaerolineae bacterium]
MNPLAQGNGGILFHIGIATALLLLVHITIQAERKATVGYQVLLVMSTLPWLQHYQWVIQTRGGWGLPEGQPSDSGLRFFMWGSPLAVYLLLFIALWLSTRSAGNVHLIAAGLPATIFLVTWFAALPLLQQDAPAEPYIADNMPQIWLFLESAVATGVLLAWAMAMKASHHKAG